MLVWLRYACQFLLLAAAVVVGNFVYDNFAFSGRLKLALQSGVDRIPGSGLVEVSSGQHDRKLSLTHYEYGGTIRQSGTQGAGMFEFFLGSEAGQSPDLSVRHNGSNLGAVIEARNASDSGAIALSFQDPHRAELRLQGRDTPDTLVVANPNRNGAVSFETGGFERARVTSFGVVLSPTRTPPSGVGVTLFVDSTDGALKVQFNDGSTTEIAAPNERRALPVE